VNESTVRSLKKQYFISAFCGSGSIGEGGGVSDGRRSQRFNIVSLLVFESFTSNFIISEHKLTYC
jgi:hypothetical protein